MSRPAPVHIRRRAGVVTILTFLLAGVLATSPAGAADPLTVDIRVELDFFGNGSSDGPRVFEVTGVEALAGQIELSEADEIENPETWCGAVTVDIDPDAELITVATEEVCNYHLARVLITSDQIHGIDLVSDQLWGAIDDEGGDPSGGPMDPVVISQTGSTFELRWELDDDEDGSFLLEGGTAVFSFTLDADEPAPTSTEAPTTTVAPLEPTTTVAPVAPTTTVPAVSKAATPVSARPAYTG